MLTTGLYVLLCVAMAGSLAAAGGAGGAVVLGIPVMVWCAALAFAIQWIAFVPAYRLRTDRFYDLTGSVTYLTVVASALWFTGRFDARSLVLAAMISVWACRLGLFLFRRVSRTGGDGRFDRIKNKASAFFVAWTVQGLWVFLTSAAALAAITAGTGEALGAWDAAGGSIWLAGMVIEVVADSQKSAFRADAGNRRSFIRSGLWSWSRHPNYFGEIVLWIGIAAMAVPTLDGWRWATLISPLFVIVLLTRISGVNLLEKRADDRWAEDPSYQAYKAATSVLVPLPPRRAGR